MVRVRNTSVWCHRHYSSQFFSPCDNISSVIIYNSNKPSRINSFSYKNVKTNNKASSTVEVDKRLVLGNTCNYYRQSDTCNDTPKSRCDFLRISRNQLLKNRTIFLNVSPICASGPSSFLCERHQHALFMHLRFYSTKTKSSRTSYYDVLGVTPNATQTQIKSAYYRLSKLHHPDTRQAGKEDKSFVSITEAYEVLGNIRKRRLYDRGVYNPRQHDDIKDGEDSEPAGPSYNESEGFTKKGRTPPTGRSKIYNFDEFYRQHYGNARMKKKINKKYDEVMEKEDEEFQRQKLRGAFLTGSLISCFFLTFVYLKSQ